MAKDKERTVNPAAQQRKVEKNKALKKAKAEKQAQRNERLAHRNPDRIQRQIDDLKALESSGEIKPREKTILADLERDLKAIYKAKESLGDKGPVNASRERPQQDRNRRNETYGRTDNNNANFTVLGKRRHDGQRKRHDEPSSGSETDESTRNIPMPRDTPPPMPRARIPYNGNNNNASQIHSAEPHALPARPPVPTTVQAKTTYISAPQIRDLKKEATSRFVPTAVKIKQDAIRGVGSTLLEPEEFDKLEQAGYIKPPNAKEQEATSPSMPAAAVSTASRPLGGSSINEEEARRLAEEEARFERELALDIDQKDTEMNIDTETTEMSSSRKDISGGESEEEEDDNDDSNALPPILSSRHNTGGKGGLFSSLPRPTNTANYTQRHVEIEEVEDEDL